VIQDLPDHHGIFHAGNDLDRPLALRPWYDKEGKFREGEWVPKGETLGGADEAVVDSLPRYKFFQAVAKGHIQIELESSMKENTEREKKEQKRPWKT